ncbi:hypothetical protein P4326_27730, partial [Bacillus thuringiensis]|nr:hypothetical protein [Bacillus thuringiensis]
LFVFVSITGNGLTSPIYYTPNSRTIPFPDWRTNVILFAFLVNSDNCSPGFKRMVTFLPDNKFGFNVLSSKFRNRSVSPSFTKYENLMTSPTLHT